MRPNCLGQRLARTFDVVFRYALSVIMQHPNVVLRTVAVAALSSGLLPPLSRFGVVLRYTVSIVIQHSENILRVLVALGCLCMKRLQVFC